MAKRETRRYADRKQYLISAVHKRRKKIRQMAVEHHREVHAEVQLSREIGIEKLGEFREA